MHITKTVSDEERQKAYDEMIKNAQDEQKGNKQVYLNEVAMGPVTPQTVKK